MSTREKAFFLSAHYTWILNRSCIQQIYVIQQKIYVIQQQIDENQQQIDVNQQQKKLMSTRKSGLPSSRHIILGF